METYRRKDRRPNSLDIQIIQDIKKNSTWEPEKQKTEDPADPPVGINRHAAVKGKEEIHNPKGRVFTGNWGLDSPLCRAHSL